MIKKLSHACVYVLNQDEALEFYTEKLGFEVRMDAKLEDFRWLTVGPKSQPDLEISLMEMKEGMVWDKQTTQKFRELVQDGKVGAGVFSTDDCQKTYEELSKKGVTFISPPQKRPYGIEAILKDNSGNWFSLTQEL